MVASFDRGARSSRSSSRKRGTAGSSRKRPVWPGVEMPAALDPYVAEAERLDAGRRRADPKWLSGIRHDALARFQALGFPTTHDEDWRFTSVAPIADGRFAL